MKVLNFLLLLFLPVLAKLACGNTLCPVDEAINEKLQSITSSLRENPHILPSSSDPWPLPGPSTGQI